MRLKAFVFGFGFALLLGAFGALPGPVQAAPWADAVRDEIVRRAGVEYLSGWVECGAQAQDVQIRIHDSHGIVLNLAPPLQSDPVRTGESGVFTVAVANLPERFRVKAIGGLCGEEGFSLMEAEFRNVDAVQDLVHVNLVTTLLARYLDRFPGTGYDDAQAAIKRYLALPDSIDLAKGPDIAEIDLSLVLFLREARVAGGFEPFMERLLAEMASDPGATFQFRAVGTVEELIAWSVEKIVGGVVSGTANKAFGYFLSAIGFPGAEQAQLLGEIRKVQAMLADVKNMIVDLGSELKDVERHLSREISVAEYDTRVSVLALSGLLDNIPQYSKELASLAALRASGQDKDPYFPERQKRLLANIEANVVPHLSLIHGFQVGQAGAKGLIQVWSETVSRHHRFLQPDDSRLMRSQFDYFDALQVSALALVLEYEYAVRTPEAAAVWVDPIVQNFRENRSLQMAMAPSAIPAGAIVETHGGLMIAPEFVWTVITGSPGQFSGGAAYGSALNHVKHLNTVKYLGFGNWRLPSKPDVTSSIFADHPSKNIGSWAIAQGYPAPYLNDDVWMFLTEGGKPMKFHLKDGKAEFFECRDYVVGWRWTFCDRGYHPNQGPYGRTIPVRTPTAQERYFYR